MLLSRRALLSGVAALSKTPTINDQNRRLLHGDPCVPMESVERWKRSANKYETAEQVMCEAKLFYWEIVENEGLTEDAMGHLDGLRRTAETRPSVQKIVDEIVEDAREKEILTECFSA